MAEEKTITLMNRGQRTIHTSAGELKPDGTIEVGEKEAHGLMDYHGIIDASKFVKASKVAADLTKENGDLKKEVAELKKEIEELKAKKK